MPRIQRLGESHQSLAEAVCAELRSRILSGALAPGQRLVEEALAATFGVSRNPVREALRVLAAEGLVEVLPRRGATVSLLTAEEAQELFDLRLAVEGVAARIAARKRNPDGLRRLEEVLAQARASTRRMTWIRWRPSTPRST